MENLKHRIEQKVYECINIANRHSTLNPLPVPKITFELDGRAAGQANWKLWEVRFNLKYAALNGDKFINQTVPHEIAHLADHRFYGGWGHGKTWKLVMRRVFGLEPERCHQFDEPEDLKRNKMHRFQYVCACPGHVITVTTRTHNQISGGRNRVCVKCRSRILYKGYAGKL